MASVVKRCCCSLRVFVLAFLIIEVVGAACKPNIVFVIADDFGWNDIGFRAPDLYTPNLDRYAREGIILNSSYLQPLCSPSRAAFLSGLFPFHTGLQHRVIRNAQKAFLPANLTLLPEVLQARGYATHAVGKWHLGFCNWKYTPTFRGFSSFLGYYTAEEDYYNRTTEIGSGYDFRNNTEVYRGALGQYSTHVYTDHAMSIIRNHDRSKPLFLYLAFQAVHTPLQVPQKYIDLYCSHILNTKRRTKCGMIAALDEAFGNITSLLDSMGFMDNMLLIFTTDNGGAVDFGGNNWPLRGSKFTLWEGGTRGTAFVYSKNKFLKTRYVNNGMMHAVDWFPTIIDAAGANHVPYAIDGLSMWNTIRLNAPSPRNEFVYNIDEIQDMAAIRLGDYKLLRGSTGLRNGWYPVPENKSQLSDEEKYPPENRFKLFNIREDPEERKDLAEQRPDILDQLKQRLKEWQATGVPANNPLPNSGAQPINWGGVWSPGWC